MMNSGKMTTIARPYANAAFEYALAKNDLLAWEKMLETAATITNDSNGMELLKSPNVSAKQLIELYSGILAPQLNEERKNFMQLLGENKRFEALPDIAALFKTAREAQEKVMTVQVTSAIPLTDSYKQQLIQALTKRLKRQVELEYAVDPNLLAGAVIRAGDTVLDGSVRGKLTRMNEFL